MKFLIIGNGYIGNYIRRNIEDSVLYAGKVRWKPELENILNKFPDHILINAAGTTGKPNVDWCETHKAETITGNITLPVTIAEVCEKLNRYWINIGSGCVYGGYEKEWNEEDLPNFTGSFYSLTKLISQNILMGYDQCCTMRIRMPIDENMSERCLITKLLKYVEKDLPIMSDMRNSITMLSDFVEALKFIARQKLIGTYNVTNSGGMSPTDVLEYYRDIIDPELKWKPLQYEELKKNLVAERSNCLLSNEKLEKAGFKMPKVQDQLEIMLKKRGKNGD